MENEAAIVMLAYIIIASIFVFFGVATLAFIFLKAFLVDINRFLKIVTILYEEEHKNKGRNDEGGFGT
jgi:hypothetical protein